MQIVPKRKGLTKPVTKRSRKPRGDSLKAKQRPKPQVRRKARTPVDFVDARERALERMKKGASQRAAAKAEGISLGKLRRYVKANTTAKLKDLKWIIIDRRPVPFRVAADGQIKQIIGSRKSAGIAGRHWNALNRFLNSNKASDLKRLKAYEGVRIRDIYGRHHQLETRPNVLRRLDSSDELSFVEMYAELAQ